MTATILNDHFCVEDTVSTSRGRRGHFFSYLLLLPHKALMFSLLVLELFDAKAFPRCVSFSRKTHMF